MGGFFSAIGNAFKNAAITIADPIGTIVNGIDSLTGGPEHRARKQARYQQDLNEQSAIAAFEREKEMWQLQNDYDLPIRQLERYGQAGINPNAVFGQTSAVGSSPTSQPQASPVDYNGSVISQYQKSAMFMQYIRQLAEVRLLNSQSKNVEADTNTKNAQLPWIDRLNAVEVNRLDAESFKTDAETNYYRKQCEVANEQINQIRENIKLLTAQTANLDQDTINKLQHYFQSDESFSKLLKNLDMDINLKGAQISHLRAQCQLIFAQATGQTLKNREQRQINAFGAKIFGSKVNAYRFQSELLGYQAEIQRVQMPSIRRIGGMNNYLQVTNNAIDVVRNAMGISSDFLDNATKPMQFGKNFVDFMQ